MNAFFERQLFVGDNQLFVEGEHVAQAVAGWAGAVGTVERKVFGCEGFKTDVAVETGVFFGVEPVGPFVSGLNHGDQQSLAGGERELDRVVDAAAHGGVNDQPVDDRLDGVFFIFLQIGGVFDFVEFAVDAHAHKALLADRLEHLFVLAFASAHQRGEQHHFGFGRNVQQLLDDVLGALLLDRFATPGAVDVSNGWKKQAQVVVDFGDGGDDGARVGTCRTLLDGDGGREALNGVDIGFLHLVEKLAGVG